MFTCGVLFSGLFLTKMFGFSSGFKKDNLFRSIASLADGTNLRNTLTSSGGLSKALDWIGEPLIVGYGYLAVA